MRLIIALVVLAISLPMGGCSRPNQAAYAMPLPSPRLSHSIKASWVNSPSPRPSRKLSRTANASPSPLPSRKVSKPKNERLVNPPTLPPKGSTQARSQTPPTGSQAASVPSPATTRHYVVVDTVGNCAVVDAKPADGLKIIGDKNGYPSSESASKALKDAKAECKDSVETEAEFQVQGSPSKGREGWCPKTHPRGYRRSKPGTDQATQGILRWLRDWKFQTRRKPRSAPRLPCTCFWDRTQGLGGLCVGLSAKPNWAS